MVVTLPGPGTSESSSKARVLLVDDDDAVRETCAALLDRKWDVVSVPSADAALKQLAVATFDVLCTDYKMPGMNGLELISHAAKLPTPPEPVLITAYAEYAQRDKKAASVSFTLLMKPYTSQDLRDAVTRAADNARIRRELNRISTRLSARG
jgi:DNA-binding NtrC family response regulator